MNFKPLAISDYPALKAFFVGQPYRLCVYSPASLIVWSNRTFKSFFAVTDGTLFVACERESHPEDRHLILPISHERSYTPSELHRFARQIGFKQYWYAPEDYLETLDRSELEAHFILAEQKEFADYIYLTEDLTLLKGNKFAKKRNLIHQFFREYTRHGRVTVENIDEGNVAECLEFLEIWCDEHACDIDQESSLACEKDAVVATLNHIAQLESKGILVRVDGAVSAFGIGSRLNDTMGTLNFEKAFSAIKGLYQFLDNECAKRLFSEFVYVNKESDMNLPNLAESKQSYNPVIRIKSFALILR